MSEILTFIICVIGLLVGVLAFMATMEYAFRNRISFPPFSGLPQGVLLTEESREDAARRQREWTRKGLIAAGVTMLVLSPFVAIAMLLG